MCSRSSGIHTVAGVRAVGPLLTFPYVGDVLAVVGILVVAGVPGDADFPSVASVFFTQKSDVI